MSSPKLFSLEAPILQVPIIRSDRCCVSHIAYWFDCSISWSQLVTKFSRIYYSGYFKTNLIFWLAFSWINVREVEWFTQDVLWSFGFIVKWRRIPPPPNYPVSAAEFQGILVKRFLTHQTMLWPNFAVLLLVFPLQKWTCLRTRCDVDDVQLQHLRTTCRLRDWNCPQLNVRVSLGCRACVLWVNLAIRGHQHGARGHQAARTDRVTTWVVRGPVLMIILNMISVLT